MYMPPKFVETNRDTLDAVIRDNSFGLLISTVDGVPVGSHLPFLLEGDRLVSHMARANPQWESFNNADVLCIFQGPHAYVSPRWYTSEKVVPTWNYVAVHVYGTPVIIDDPDTALAMQRQLVTTHEAGADSPWSMDGLPESFVAGQLRAIVNFEIPIARIEGKFKLNQNRSADDRAGVITALGVSPNSGDRAVSALMAKREPERPPQDGDG